MPKNSYIVGFDIGTRKVVAIIGEVTEERKIEIIGIGTADSHGLRKGVVVNLDATTTAIKKAQEEAELMAGVEIDSAFFGISGAHIKSFNSRGVVAVSGKNREITPRGHPPRRRPVQGHPHPAGPGHHPRHPPGVHRRRPGRHQGPGRHERHQARGQRPHRHRPP